MIDGTQNSLPEERGCLSDKQLANIELDRKCYDSIASAQATLLDKSIISIAGASFSFSIGFIDKLIPLDKAAVLWILWLAMLILALSIIVTVLSFWVGENCAIFMRKLCDDAEKTCDTDILYGYNPWKNSLDWLNKSRLIFFVLGIGLLAGFIFYNGITRVSVKDYKQQHGVHYDNTAAQNTTQPYASSKENSDSRTGRGNVTSAASTRARDSTEGNTTQKIAGLRILGECHD